MICAINIQAEKVEGLVTPYVYGHSGPGTFIGFATALGLNLEKKLRQIDDSVDEGNPVLVEEGVVSLFHFYQEHQKLCYIKKSDENTILDTPKVNEEITVVFKLNDIEFENEEVLNEIEQINNEYTKTNKEVLFLRRIILNEVKKMRFGGGYIKNVKVGLFLDDENEKMITSLKSGFIMQKGKIYENFEDLLSSTDVNKETRNENAGWNTISLLGYALLQEPKVKEYSRFGLPHSFAEPLLGPIHFESLKKSNFKGKMSSDIFEVGWIVVRQQEDGGDVIHFDMKKNKE